MPALKEVGLVLGNGTDPSPLAGHPSLEHLSMDNFSPTDDWLKVLKSLSRLRTLNVGPALPEGADYEKVSSALVEQLQRELPNCKVGDLK